MNTDKTRTRCLLVCDCPLTRLLSTALFAPFTRFLADPLGAEESQTCLIRHRRRRSLSVFIRVHPWPFRLSSRFRRMRSSAAIPPFLLRLPLSEHPLRIVLLNVRPPAVVLLWPVRVILLRAPIRQGHREHQVVVRPFPPRRVLLVPRRRYPDRKSTRLNSS